MNKNKNFSIKFLNNLITILGFAVIAIVVIWYLSLIARYESGFENALKAIETGESELAISILEKTPVRMEDYSNCKFANIAVKACEKGDTTVIRYLADEGTNFNISILAVQTQTTKTPLEAFCETGWHNDPSLLKIMLDAGADPNQYYKEPPLFVLAKQLYWEYTISEEEKKALEDLCIMLVQAGAELKYNGNTILHLATKTNATKLFNALISTEEGLNLINAENREGKTAWEVAIQYNADSVLSTLKVLKN